MSKYKHILFDIDGTLIDTEEAILRSLQDTVREMLHKNITTVKLEVQLRHRLPPSLERSGKGGGRRW